jgi:hypothetical protein
MVALRRARPYGGLSQVRPYRGLRPRLACESWIARFQHLVSPFVDRIPSDLKNGV